MLSIGWFSLVVLSVTLLAVSGEEIQTDTAVSDTDTVLASLISQSNSLFSFISPANSSANTTGGECL